MTDYQPFAANTEARTGFLEAIKKDPGASIRTLIEPLGYKRHDVQELLRVDEEFAEDYRHARGHDADAVLKEVRKVAFGPLNLPSKMRALQMLLKMTPEYRFLASERHEIAGRVEVQGVPFLDVAKLGVLEEPRSYQDELAELRYLLEKAQPELSELPREGRPALELLPPA
jgi:hypothetical protein